MENEIKNIIKEFANPREETLDNAVKRICALFNVSHSGLTEEEVKERNLLLELQKDHTRWFSKEEFDRLKELSNKMFETSCSPHCG